MDTNTTDKKISFEDLTKDELVKKCKTFLTIVQKAKQSKRVLQEEIDQLKMRLESTEKKEVPPAVDEIIQDLTEQKLNFVVAMEDLKLKNESLLVNLNQYKEEKKRLGSELNRIDSENVAFKRQVTRLTDENEQLINHLESLEKQIQELNRIGLEQQQQLLELEDRNQHNSKQQEKIQELEKMLSISLDEIKKMKTEAEVTQKEKHSEDNLEESNKVMQIKEKLKNYHSKIIKLANNIKQLKEDKNVILDQFKMYTDQVKEWENKLNLASKKLLIFVKTCEKENETLKQNNQHLKDLNARFMEQLEAHKTDDEKSKELEEMDTLKLKNLKLIEELEKSKESQLIVCSENEKIKNENNGLKNIIEDLKIEINNTSKCLVDEKKNSKQKLLSC
ncbi:hypothetical protein HHI36_004327 [Cryptolaemus montrouzieri]|uniref:Uncharacterized protein n=1 Tax=Cryptolaemus montrouzieri TaxID=559131 RepID=A0ABD2NQU4_9CUCU